ncbi:hypothetical protein NDU88_006257 [Pleurodeles waltl]|uniref:Uncharacterized protein n=1 Tax=Pleurodeles waltl TaxID=8319 RepID=A0AAV7VQI5_PLEWA|nr:hypothetical protein NDU88_006257 [Pleurodeles waltl]
MVTGVRQERRGVQRRQCVRQEGEGIERRLRAEADQYQTQMKSWEPVKKALRTKTTGRRAHLTMEGEDVRRPATFWEERGTSRDKAKIIEKKGTGTEERKDMDIVYIKQKSKETDIAERERERKQIISQNNSERQRKVRKVITENKIGKGAREKGVKERDKRTIKRQQGEKILKRKKTGNERGKITRAKRAF